MRRFRFAALAAAALLAHPGPSWGQDPMLEDIRRQIQQLRETYEKQIQQLEERLKAAEEAAAKAQAAATQAQQAASQAAQTATQAQGAAVQAQTQATEAQTSAQAAAAQATPAQQASQNAFNPGISLILNGHYANFSEDPARASVTGFQSNADAADALGLRGFSLGESELTFSANIDHLFYGQATFAFESEGGVEVEEAFAQTSALGHGLTVKGGRFFSAIGYENSIHAHAWDFIDPALVQRVFLGNNYADDGLQLRWIAPLPVFVELGGEIGRGLNPPGSNRDKNGVGAWTLFAHVGGDIGSGGSYLVGASTLQTSTDSNGIPVADLDDRTGTTSLFNGDTQTYGLDFVYKWAPDGNPRQRNFKLIAEWFQQRRSGSLVFDESGTLGVGPATEPFKLKQSGWYVQAVYQFLPQWRTGLRYDQLDQGSWDTGPIAAANGAITPDFAPRRYSAMIDWNPSEFSRLRLQYNQDRSQAGTIDNQIFLQYIFSLGAHGAHKF